MIPLAESIVAVILDEYDRDFFLRRISDPYWFQALGCVLGYDWHSSGVTTVLTGVLKGAINREEFGIAVCGGKGKASLKTPSEIAAVGEDFGFSSQKIDVLTRASKMSAKVDNTAVQDGYSLYHHVFFLTEDGKWAVIQQGMSAKEKSARRYHWLSETVETFVVEPHTAILGDRVQTSALNMTARESEGTRKVSVDIAKEPLKKVAGMLRSIQPSYQSSLEEWLPRFSSGLWTEPVTDYLFMPSVINWKALKQAYEFQPRDFEELLSIKGVGPATVRGLALISELIYGEKPSWKDPVKYSFAYGGKDGVPFPVDRTAMDDSIRVLKEAIENSQVGTKKRLESLRRLRRFVPSSRAN